MRGDKVAAVISQRKGRVEKIYVSAERSDSHPELDVMPFEAMQDGRSDFSSTMRDYAGPKGTSVMMDRVLATLPRVIREGSSPYRCQASRPDWYVPPKDR